MPPSSRPWSSATPSARRRPGTVLACAVVVLTAGGTALTGCGGPAPSPTTPHTVDRGAQRSPSPSPARTVSPPPSPPAAQTPEPSPPTPPVDPGPALESATWGTREGGRSLAVVPAPWVRTSEDPTAIDRLWAELVEAEPEADAPGMFDQLLCHALGAADKDSWNLEPWRPDVGLIAVMSARCNPV